MHFRDLCMKPFTFMQLDKFYQSNVIVYKSGGKSYERRPRNIVIDRHEKKPWLFAKASLDLRGKD